jgi:multicomponent Na+:H+ antiporter subunit C
MYYFEKEIFSMAVQLFHNYYETAAVILFGIGFTALLLHRNMIKKIIGLNIMDTAVYLFLAAKGYVEGRMAPIVTNGVQSKEAYVNPVPSGLVLTGIVVSVSVTAVMLALTIRLYRRYESLDIDEISMKARKEAH